MAKISVLTACVPPACFYILHSSICTHCTVSLCYWSLWGVTKKEDVTIWSHTNSLNPKKNWKNKPEPPNAFWMKATYYNSCRLIFSWSTIRFCSYMPFIYLRQCVIEVFCSTSTERSRKSSSLLLICNKKRVSKTSNFHWKNEPIMY